MPKLPAPYDLASSGPTPTRGVNRVGTPDVRQQSTIGLLNELGEMAARESDRLDDIAAEDALNKLQDRKLALTYDTKEGFTQILGDGVIKRPVLDEYSGSFQKEIDSIGKGLKSARAKQRFSQKAQGLLGSFRGDLYRHVAGQVEKFEDDTDTATFKRLAAETAEGGVDPSVRASVLGRANEALGRVATRRGMSGDLLNVYRREKLGDIHASAIEAMLKVGRAEEAEEYFNANSDAMTEGQISGYQEKIKSRVNWNISSRAADAGMGVFLKARDKAAAVAAIEKETKGNEEAHKDAISLLNERISAQNTAEQEVQGGFYNQFETTPTHATANGVYSSAEFLALPKTKQAEVRKYFRSELEQAEARGRIKEADKANDPEALALLWHLTEDKDALSRMSDAAINYYRPQLGKYLVSRAITERNAVRGGAARFSIDKDLIEESMPIAVRGKSADKQQKQDAYRGIIERRLMEWKDQHPGSTPSMADQREIISGAIKSYTQPGMLFGTNEVPAYDLKPMPADFERAARGYAKSKGLREPTYDELLAQWATQKDSRR